MIPTDTLIRALAAQTAPVAPLPRPAVRVVQWLCVVLPVVGAAALVVGLRADLLAKLDDASFAFRASALVLGAVATVFAAFTVGVPGAPHAMLVSRVTVVVALCAIALGVAPTASFEGAAGVGVRCVRNLLMFGCIGALPIGLMLRRSAGVVMARQQLFFATCACGLLADIATRFICSDDRPLHLLAWHALPVAFVAVLVVAGRHRRWDPR